MTRSVNQAFDAGDKISTTITFSGVGNSGSFSIVYPGGVENGNTFPDGVYAYNSTVVTAGNLVSVTTGSSSGTSAVTMTCISINPPTKINNAASSLLDQIRQQFSKIVAGTTSTNTGESVTGAITDAFNGGGTTQFNNGRVSTSFAAIENEAANRAKTDDAREAFAALGYAKRMVTKAPPIAPAPLYQSPWHVWIDARYTATDDKRVSSFDGKQTNVTGGISYKFNEYFLAGLVTGYEDFNYELGFRNAKLDGNGWNAGGYFGWRFWDRLRLDGMLTWGKINYGAQADAVTAGFDADRVTSMLRLSGRYGLAANWYIEPSGRLIYAREKQDAFTDTAGVLHPNYSFNVGLASFGGEVGAPTIWGSWIVTPSIGLFGDYRFGTDNVQSVAVLPNLDDGWSARVTGNLRWSAPNGFTASVGGQYGGLGSDTTYWQAKGSLGMKF